MSKVNQNKAQNPMSEYLLKIQTIITNTEFKDKAEAELYETLETREEGNAYVRAVTKTDIFESYTYDPKEVYRMLESYGYKDKQIFYYINNPQMIPQKYKEMLMNEKRDILIASYKEKNRYYVRLTGQPFPGDETSPPEEVLLIPDDFYNLYRDDDAIHRNQPVHEMPLKYQELFINSDYYKMMIREHPDAKYLQYIGSNAIPIHVSRPAKDGEILRINTSKLSIYNDVFGNISVSPDIVHGFSNIYKETRDYVYNTLRGDFSAIYPNYNSFIRFLTIYLSIGNALNEFMKKSSSLIYMNNVTANNFFMLYGLPSVIMKGASMIDFLKKFRLILMDKGTNIVYRVKDLIGYEYTDIYTLVMVKQQVFENGVPVYHYDKDGNKIPKQEIVFRRLGTTDDNTSYFKFRERRESYDWEMISSGDPRWWNSPEIEQMLYDMNYTLSNSKYIQLSTHLSMSDIWWQCVILLRGLLDTKQETQFTMLNLNFNVDGSSQLSVFEAVLVLVILMNWQLKDNKGNTMSGNMYIPNGMYDGKYTCLDLLFNGIYHGLEYQMGVQYFKGQLVGYYVDELYEVVEDYVSQDLESDINTGRLIPSSIEDGTPKELLLGMPYKISSFNFKFREEKPEFYQSIKDMDYIEPDVFLPMLDKVLDREEMNLGEIMMTDVKLIYKYLEDKLRTSTTIHEFRQVTDIFSNLFLVDPVRNWYDESTFNTDAVLMDEFNITQLELSSLKSFFYADDGTQLSVTYQNVSYPINLYYVLNYDVKTIEINGVFPFRDNGFVSEFTKVMSNTVINSIINDERLSSGVRNNYQQIINTKVLLDVGSEDGSPKTFESLLFRTNASLYTYLLGMRSNNENLVLLMRSIVKALESYTNSQLSGLEFKAIGVEQYFYILKEVITYFKSYMVEFTKDEFVYIFDGLFDNGGSSNMLRLYDEITSADIEMIPRESLTMYDVSYADMFFGLPDDNIGVMYDEAIFRLETTYQTLLDTGYEIWYDDGKKITRTPYDIEPSTKVIANIIANKDTSTTPPSSAYKIIININNLNVVPPNYVGNTR